MRLEEGHDDIQRVVSAITTILEKNTLLSLSTFVDDEIWTSTLFYAYDKDFNLYVVTDPNTKHGKMITKNNNVSGAIYSTDAIWGTDIQGLQFTATIERVSAKSIIFHGGHYLKRFPVAKKFIASPELLLSDKMQIRLYRLRPKIFQIYDEITFKDGNHIRRILFD